MGLSDSHYVTNSVSSKRPFTSSQYAMHTAADDTSRRATVAKQSPVVHNGLIRCLRAGLLACHP